MWPTTFYSSAELIFFLSYFYSVTGIFIFLNSSICTPALKYGWYWLVCFHSSVPEMQIREQCDKRVLWEISCTSLKKCILHLCACLQCHWGGSLTVLILLISYFFNLDEHLYECKSSDVIVKRFGLLKMQISRLWLKLRTW